MKRKTIAPKNIHPKFEYRVEKCIRHHDLERALNYFGDDGWELVSFITSEEQFLFTIILKRKV